MLQHEGQSALDYIQDLKILSGKCDFGTFQDEALIDQLIFGIADSSVRKQLLAADKPHFDQAAQIELQHDAIEKDSAIFDQHFKQIYSLLKLLIN